MLHNGEEVLLLSGANKDEKKELDQPNDDDLLNIADKYFSMFIAMNKKKGQWDGIKFLTNPKQGRSRLAQMMETAVLTGDGDFSVDGVFDSLSEQETELARKYADLQPHAIAIESRFIAKAKDLYPHIKQNFLKNIADLYVQRNIIADSALKKLGTSHESFRLRVKTCLHLKEDVMGMLRTYSERIEGYGGNYETGFKFFKTRQAKNREDNYNLSKKLHAELSKKDVNIATLFSAANISALRGGGTVRSDKLNEAIEAARQFGF